MSEVITADLVDLDLKAADRQSASRQLAERLVKAGRVTDIEGFLADIAKRESQMPTGLEGGIGIPHCRSAHVTEPSLAFGRASEGVDFGAPDGPADIIFLIAAPEGGDASHMKILASLARRLIRAQFKETLRSRQGPGGGCGVHPQGGELAMKFVAVTSCPTGIAHTYMAAEALEQAAAEAGDEMHVETQGSAGSDPLDPAIIAAADAVIFAADVEVRDRERFAGKPLVAVRRQAGHRRRGAMLAEARAAADGRPAGRRRRAGGGRRGRRAGHQGRLRRRVRHAAAPVADDRRVVHDPVRRRGRHADRPELRRSAATRSINAHRRSPTPASTGAACSRGPR